MSDRRVTAAAAWVRDLDRKRCPTPGHEDRHVTHLVDAPPPGRGKRWVCQECADTPETLDSR